MRHLSSIALFIATRLERASAYLNFQATRLRVIAEVESPEDDSGVAVPPVKLSPIAQRMVADGMNRPIHVTSPEPSRALRGSLQDRGAR